LRQEPVDRPGKLTVELAGCGFDRKQRLVWQVIGRRVPRSTRGEVRCSLTVRDRISRSYPVREADPNRCRRRLLRGALTEQGSTGGVYEVERGARLLNRRAFPPYRPAERGPPRGALAAFCRPNPSLRGPPVTVDESVSAALTLSERAGGTLALLLPGGGAKARHPAGTVVRGAGHRSVRAERLRSMSR